MPEATAQRVKSFEMPFNSMEPAIPAGSQVIADMSYYSSHAPKRWDVVVFSLPKGSGQFIKRIVGLPGETIQLTSVGVKVNGNVLSVPLKVKDSFSRFHHHPGYKHLFDVIKIPEDSVFLLGDHSSCYISDSRELGPIPVSSLEGRVFASAQVTLL